MFSDSDGAQAGCFLFNQTHFRDYHWHLVWPVVVQRNRGTEQVSLKQLGHSQATSIGAPGERGNTVVHNFEILMHLVKATKMLNVVTKTIKTP